MYLFNVFIPKNSVQQFLSDLVYFFGQRVCRSEAVIWFLITDLIFLLYLYLYFIYTFYNKFETVPIAHIWTFILQFGSDKIDI